MRKAAFLRKPLPGDEGRFIFKIMLYETDAGVSLFAYDSPEAQQCVSDRWYASLSELYEDWNERIDERGWIALEDPLPGCQHDAFLPLRVKGRDLGKPEWGKYEILRDGSWVPYRPE